MRCLATLGALMLLANFPSTTFANDDALSTPVQSVQRPPLLARIQDTLRLCGQPPKQFENDEEAIEELKLASDPPAKPSVCVWGLMELAQIYETGEGVEKNAALAYAYAYKANLGFMPAPVTPSRWGSVQENNDVASRRILSTPLTHDQALQVRAILRDYRQKFSRTPVDIETIDISPQNR